MRKRRKHVQDIRRSTATGQGPVLSSTVIELMMKILSEKMRGTSAPWSIVLTKLTQAMEQWSNVSVNLSYKQHIIQCTVGGYSQYLAQVQACPTRVEAQIKKQISKYLRDGKSSKVNQETTDTPID
jgi:hypothetical protein